MAENDSKRPLTQLTNNSISILFGVCAGVAYWLGINTTIVRFVVALLLFSSLSSYIIVIYCILMIILPENDEIPEDYEHICK